MRPYRADCAAPACSTACMTHVELHDVQMGGPEGVRRSEQYTLVIGLKNGTSHLTIPFILQGNVARHQHFLTHLSLSTCRHVHACHPAARCAVGRGHSLECCRVAQLF